MKTQNELLRCFELVIGCTYTDQEFLLEVYRFVCVCVCVRVDNEAQNKLLRCLEILRRAYTDYLSNYVVHVLSSVIISPWLFEHWLCLIARIVGVCHVYLPLQSKSLNLLVHLLRLLASC